MMKKKDVDLCSIDEVVVMRLRREHMNSTFIVGTGIALIAVSAVLFITSIIYRSTAGRRIREELNREYR